MQWSEAILPCSMDKLCRTLEEQWYLWTGACPLVLLPLRAEGSGRRGLTSAPCNKPISITGRLKGTLLPAVGPVSGKQRRRKARSLNDILAKTPLTYTQGGAGEASASANPPPAQLHPLIQQRRNLPPTTSEGLKN